MAVSIHVSKASELFVIDQAIETGVANFSDMIKDIIRKCDIPIDLEIEFVKSDDFVDDLEGKIEIEYDEEIVED